MGDRAPTKYNDIIELLYRATVDAQRGQIVPHEFVEETLGLGRKERLYYYLVSQWRSLMRERKGIAVWPVSGTGWRLETIEGQIVGIPQRRLKKQKNQVKLTSKDVNAIDTSTMSLHEQRLYQSTRTMLSRRREALERDEREFALLYGKK